MLPSVSLIHTSTQGRPYHFNLFLHLFVLLTMNQLFFFKSRSYLLMFFTDSCFQLMNASVFSLGNSNDKKDLIKIFSCDIK